MQLLLGCFQNPNKIQCKLKDGNSVKHGCITLRKKNSHLVDRSQIAVSISKSRVDLDGTGVALQGSLYILHFLQCVAHVRVGISKCRADSEMKFQTIDPLLAKAGA